MCPPVETIAPVGDLESSTTSTKQNLDFIPPTRISKSAYNLASSLLHPAILNHSIRVYLYANLLAQRTSSIYSMARTEHDLLFTACILHDIGTVSKFDGPQRFEVEGGDAAVALLRENGVSEDDAHQVWMAIALHSTPGISERINELSRLVRQAVLIDFGRKTEILGDHAGLKKGFEEVYPRGEVEKVLGDEVVKQARRDPGKAPAASWPNNLYRAWLEEPGWEGVNKGF